MVVVAAGLCTKIGEIWTMGSGTPWNGQETLSRDPCERTQGLVAFTPQTEWQRHVRYEANKQYFAELKEVEQTTDRIQFIIA